MPVTTVLGRATILRRANIARKRGTPFIVGAMAKSPVTRNSANDATDDDAMPLDSCIVPGGLMGDFGYLTLQANWSKSASGTARLAPRANGSALALQDLAPSNTGHGQQIAIWSAGSQTAQESPNNTNWQYATANAILSRSIDTTIDWTISLNAAWTTQPIALNEWIKLHKWVLWFHPIG